MAAAFSARVVDSNSIAAFTKFIDEHQRDGCDVKGAARSYVSPCDLRDYWTDAKVRAALQSYAPGSTASFKSVRNDYCRVFSALHYTERLYQLDREFLSFELNDTQFPLMGWPQGWPSSQPPFYKTCSISCASTSGVSPR